LTEKNSKIKKQLTSMGVLFVGPLLSFPVMGNVEVMGSIQVGVGYIDSGWRVSNNESSIGFGASSSLGQDSSVFMKYEFGVDSAKGSLETGDNKYLSFVGINGPWGSLSLGAQWSTLYNTVGTFIDQSEFFGGESYQGQERMKDSVVFSYQSGRLFFQSDLQLDSGDGDLDRFSVGTIYKVGKVSVGLAWQDNGLSDFSGIGGSIQLGDVSLSGGYNRLSDTHDSFGVGARVSNCWIGYDDIGGAGSDSTVTGNYEFELGEQTSFLLEISNNGENTQGIGFLQLDF
jgi:predicted porin